MDLPDKDAECLGIGVGHDDGRLLPKGSEEHGLEDGTTRGEDRAVHSETLGSLAYHELYIARPHLRQQTQQAALQALHSCKDTELKISTSKIEREMVCLL